MAKDRTANATSFMPVKKVYQEQNLHWHSTSTTELGFVRSVNEDAHLDAREHNLWVVADGMGGHSYGDEASRAIIDQLVSFRQHEDLQSNIDDLTVRLEQAHELCLKEKDGQVMGSTVATLYIHDNICVFLWAGDSRIYRFRNNLLEQMTTDHSLVQELVTIGELERKDMEKHPSSNIITRAVGVHSELELELRQELVEPGDKYLICSDGLYKDVEEQEIADGMALATIEENLDCLVDLAMERGGTDNTTAIIVQAS